MASAVFAHQAAHGQLTPGEATKIVLELAKAIGRAHQLSPSIVHRDLKPANVLVRAKKTPDQTVPLITDSEFLITDFGIGGVASKKAIEQAQQGTASTPLLTAVAGAYTPLYAPPEQKEGKRPDPRDDVHALGVIWYQLLIGDMSQGIPPDWSVELQERKVDGGIIDVLGRCIAGKAERRLSDAVALAEQIERILGPSSVPAIAVVSSRNPAVYGDAVTFMATVKAVPPAVGVPSGQVAFMDGVTALGEAELSGGTASLTTSSLSSGSHAISVSYRGDGCFSGSTSTPWTQNITPDQGPLKAGDVVWAQWKPNAWYHGRIAKVEGDRYHIAFDDGDKAVVTATKLALDHAPERELVAVRNVRVLAKFKKGRFYPGKIIGFTDDQFDVQFDDGDKDTVGLKDLRLIRELLKGNGEVMPLLRKEQVRILAALAKANKPLTRKEIAEQAPCDRAWTNMWLGAHNPDIRARNDEEFPSLLSLGYVVENDGERDGRQAWVYEITVAGRDALK